jgi:DNA polymerase elongation subunit (family B)
MINCREKNKIDKDSMVFFDLETFQEDLCHEAYACGYCVGEQEIKIDYGKDCMNNFLDDILSYENKTICAYNGARFDFYLLIDKLTDRGVDIHDIILANGSILSFKFGTNNRVFDLCKFIMSS